MQLESALERLKALSVDNASKRAIEDTLRAASNPDHGRVDVIVKSLPIDRQKIIGKTARAMQSITDDVIARGKKRLLAMSDAEWQKLIEDDE